MDEAEKCIKAQEIAERARDSISEYCFSECNAYCCRKGYLLLSDEEADLVAHEYKAALMDGKSLVKVADGKNLLDLTSGKNGCPRLGDDHKCTIHKNPKRPRPCKEFPVFIWSNSTVRLARRCPAVKENKFYPYVKEFISLGYRMDED